IAKLNQASRAGYMPRAQNHHFSFKYQSCLGKLAADSPSDQTCRLAAHSAASSLATQSCPLITHKCPIPDTAMLNPNSETGMGSTRVPRVSSGVAPELS